MKVSHIDDLDWKIFCDNLVVARHHDDELELIHSSTTNSLVLLLSHLTQHIDA